MEPQGRWQNLLGEPTDKWVKLIESFVSEPDLFLMPAGSTAQELSLPHSQWTCPGPGVHRHPTNPGRGE